jgi:hypothetical protein
MRRLLTAAAAAALLAGTAGAALADEWLLRKEMESQRLRLEADAIRRETALLQEMHRLETEQALQRMDTEQKLRALRDTATPSLPPAGKNFIDRALDAAAADAEDCGRTLFREPCVGGAFTEWDFYCQPMPTAPEAKERCFDGSYRGAPNAARR